MVKRKDIVNYIKNVAHDPAYGHCETCKHYQHLMICGECYAGHNYSFDYQTYYNEHINDIDKWLKEGNHMENLNKIKFVRKYFLYGIESYDVIYKSGRLCIYSVDRLPQTIKTFISGRKPHQQYDKIFNRDEWIFE